MSGARLLKALVALTAAAAPAAALAQASPSPFTTGYRYDAERRLTGTIAPDPDGAGPLHHAAQRNSYDDAGRLVRVEKGELASWQSEAVAPSAWTGFTVYEREDTAYDALDRAVTRSAMSGSSPLTLTQTSYDDAGRVDCVAVRMNPATWASLPASACALTAPGPTVPDRITHNVWDAAGQLLKVQKAYGVTTGNAFPATLQQDYATYEYTENGKQKAVTDANGNRAELTWDGHDRQARWVFPSAAGGGSANQADYEEYVYDPNGNRVTLKKRDGALIGYQYDALDRVTVKTVPGSATGAAGYSVYTGYDNRGLELYARFGSAGGAGITSGYDNAGRLASSTTNMDGTARTLAYGYDADGNRISASGMPDFYTGWDYDGADRPKAVRDYSGGVTDAIRYDPAGRRAGVEHGLGGVPVSTMAYGYDAAGRLQTQAHDLAGTSADQSTTFGYNPASQLVSEARTNGAYAFTRAQDVARTYGVNGLNQYTAAGPAGAQSPFGYDLNGNLTDTPAADGGTTHYTYDAENRLVQAATSGGSTGTSTVTLAYDPDGRLWQVSAPTGTTRYVYDGDRRILEYDGAGTLLRGYHWGPGTDEPFIWYELTGGPVVRFLHADHQGSIVAVADQSGNPLAVNAYDPWGIPNTTNQGRFGYTGQAWFPELGMWYYKARIYSPTLGRFLQTDPIGYKDQVNLYAYVSNDPIGGRDSSGLADRVVVYNQSTNSYTVVIPVRFEGTGAAADTLSRVQAVANEMHAPAGEAPVHYRVELDPTGTGDTQTVHLSPNKDYSVNGAGEGNKIAQRWIHIDSRRTDAPAAIFHDLHHGGRHGHQGARDRYSPTRWDANGHPIESSPHANYENNIMGTTNGREITNDQVRNEIAPQSKGIVIPIIPPF